MAKKKTNVQFIKSIIDNSKFGVMKQAFIMEAIRQYTDNWKKPEFLEEMNKMYSDNDGYYGFIKLETWHEIAKETDKELEERMS